MGSLLLVKSDLCSANVIIVHWAISWLIGPCNNGIQLQSTASINSFTENTSLLLVTDNGWSYEIGLNQQHLCIYMKTLAPEADIPGRNK